MTTDREISRFISNLPPEEEFGYFVLAELCRHYNWHGWAYSINDLREVYEVEIGEDITETELEELWDSMDIAKVVSMAIQPYYEEVVHAHYQRSIK